jgi:hypothetical protein
VRTVVDQSFRGLTERILVNSLVRQAQLVDRLYFGCLGVKDCLLRMIQFRQQVLRVRGHDHLRRVGDREAQG